MSPSDYTKKLLEDAGWLAGDKSGAERVVETLRRSPSLLNRVEPPAGYEKQLLAALSRQLPLEKKSAPRAVASPGFLRRPAFAWAVTGVFALLAVVSVSNFSTGFDPSSHDLLAQTARKGGEEVVGDWMASMGDTALQKRVAMADINAAANNLGSVKDRRVVENVLTDVARKMGMK